MLENYFITNNENSELSLFAETIEKFCDQEIEPYYVQWEKDGAIPRSLYRKLGEQGLLCVDVPEAYGGLGAGVRFSFMIDYVLSKRGYGGLVGGLQVHTDIIPPYLVDYGTEAQKKYWLPRLVTGECISAIGMTEPNAGSDLKNIRTFARKDGDRYIINGSKIFISNGQNANLFIIAAKTDRDAGARGIGLFLVDADTPGFQRGQNLDKIGHHSGDTSELFFEDMAVPADALLGKESEGFIQMMEKLPRERLIIGVQALGMAQGARDRTVQYVQEREAFGAPISKLQNTRFKLAEVEAELAASAAFTEHCIEAYIRGSLSPELVSALKLQTTEMLARVVDECLQLFGGYGYMTEYPVSRIWADARVLRIYGGTSEIMKELIARSVLGR